MLEPAERVDTAEDELHGEGQQSRSQRAQACGHEHGEGEAHARDLLDQQDEDGNGERPFGGAGLGSMGDPRPKAQRNVTDPNCEHGHSQQSGNCRSIRL